MVIVPCLFRVEILHVIHAICWTYDESKGWSGGWGTPESLEVGWYPHNITGSSHLKPLLRDTRLTRLTSFNAPGNKSKYNTVNSEKM